jgi:hypothetical protein
LIAFEGCLRKGGGRKEEREEGEREESIFAKPVLDNRYYTVKGLRNKSGAL